MLMAAMIRCRCSECGAVDLSSEGFSMVRSLHGYTRVRYTCLCGTEVDRVIDHHTRDELVRAGVPSRWESEHVEAEGILTVDDLIDLHFFLEQEDYVAQWFGG